MRKLRIFYAAPSSAHPAFPHSRVWYNNLYLPLLDLGHEVVPFKYDLTQTYQHVDVRNPAHVRFITANRPALERALLEQIRTEHAKKPLDLFFSYFYSACASAAAIRQIRDLGIVTMNWFCNASYQFYLIEELAPAYDWCLVPEKFRLDDYRRVGARPLYCQEAANPGVYHPYDEPLLYDVGFIGQAYGERPDIIRYLFDCGIDIHVWGAWWKDFSAACRPGIRTYLRRMMKKILHPGNTSGRKTVLPSHVVGDVLDDEEMIRMYSRSRINLGFSTCGSTHEQKQRITQIRLRDFEIPMSGGFYMVEYSPELEDFFDIGSEIVCYTNREDLKEKIRHYLSREDERKAIAAAGRARCLDEHTWQHRFTHVFTHVNLT